MKGVTEARGGKGGRGKLQSILNTRLLNVSNEICLNVFSASSGVRAGINGVDNNDLLTLRAKL